MNSKPWVNLNGSFGQSCRDFPRSTGSRRPDRNYPYGNGVIHPNVQITRVLELNENTTYVQRSTSANRGYHQTGHDTRHFQRVDWGRSVAELRHPRTSRWRTPSESDYLSAGGCVNIRQREQREIQEGILQGGIVQVAGGPMVGKSTTVSQVRNSVVRVSNFGAKWARLTPNGTVSRLFR